MEYGQTIPHDRQRFLFTLFLQHSQGTPVSATFAGNVIANVGYTWRVDWRSLIGQSLPVGSKLLVRHRFFGEVANTAAQQGVQNSQLIVQQGLPSVQTFTVFTTGSFGGQCINICEQQTASFNAALFSSRFVSEESTFVCGIPPLCQGEFTLLFYDLSGEAVGGNNLQEPVNAGDGAHMMIFELVADM